MWCWSAQIYKHVQCQFVKCRCKLARQSRLQNFLKLALPQVRYNLLINSYFVINDFSDIVFFKKDSYSTWRLILEELLPPDTFTISKDCIYHLELHIQIQCKNINIYPDKVRSSFECWTYIYILVRVSSNSTSVLMQILHFIWLTLLEDYQQKS